MKLTYFLLLLSVLFICSCYQDESSSCLTCKAATFNEIDESNAFGSLYYHNDSTALIVVINSTGYYFNITNLTTSLFYNTRLNQSAGTIEILISGTYKIDYSISFAGGASQEYQVITKINDSMREECEFHRKLGTGGDVGNGGGTCLLNLTRGMQVHLGIQDENVPTKDANIFAMNFNLHKIK